MSYTKQNFQSGAVLMASQLNAMDNKITELDTSNESLKDELATFDERLTEVENSTSVGEGGGLPKEAGELLVYILRNGMFTADMKNYINTFAEKIGLGGSGDTPDEPAPPPVDVYFSIATTLDNATISNNAQVIKEGSTFNTTISPVDGYNIASITVTMGGVDISESVVSGDEIAIPSVTGDVAITVVTVEKQAEPIYELGVTEFNYSANNYINTGIKLCDTDKDVTIMLAFPSKGINNYILACNKGSTGKDGYSIQGFSNTEPKYFAFGEFGTCEFGISAGNEQRIILVHSAGSGKAKYYWNSTQGLKSKELNITFEAHDEPLYIGCNYWNGIAQKSTGTINLVKVYDKVLNEDAITSFING